MSELTPNFTREEFELDGPMPEEAVESYRQLCLLTLEPVRAHFGEPLVITSGYRSPGANETAGGVAHSQHEATATCAAADARFDSMAVDMRPAFDWVRESGNVDFDQMILEHDPWNGRDILHFSWATTRRRMALEGETNNLSAYTSHPVTPLNV